MRLFNICDPNGEPRGTAYIEETQVQAASWITDSLVVRVIQENVGVIIMLKTEYDSAHSGALPAILTESVDLMNSGGEVIGSVMLPNLTFQMTLSYIKLRDGDLANIYFKNAPGNFLVDQSQIVALLP
jgi:hypothetical protein